MFAGYDLFREGKVRRFWARQPGSTLRPRLLERLYPVPRALAGRAAGDGAAVLRPQPRRAPRSRASRTTRAGTPPARSSGCSRADVRAAIAGRDAVARAARRRCPREFARWTPLAQDQYLEMRTLLSGYLLSSQGDRMLMAHSVEGRFPFLDGDVVALANSLPRCVQAARARREARAQARRRRRSCRPRSSRARSSPTARPTRSRSSAPTRRPRSTSCCRERALARRRRVRAAARSRSCWRKCRARADDGAVLQRRQHGAGRRALDPAPAPAARARRRRAIARRRSTLRRPIVEHRDRATSMHGAVPLLHDYLADSAARLPDKVALVCGERSASPTASSTRARTRSRTPGRARRRARRSRGRLRRQHRRDGGRVLGGAQGRTRWSSIVNPLTKARQARLPARTTAGRRRSSPTRTSHASSPSRARSRVTCDA